MAAWQLQVEDVTKRFGGVEAVSHLSLTLEEGGVLGVIGPNGAGKSTLLSLISGGQRPSDGHITFAGQRIDRMSTHAVARLGIGRAHQIPRPFGRMNVLDNVRVAAHSVNSGGQRALERDTSARDVLDVCGLNAHADRLAGSLNLLDLKRLEIARALALQPRLLLLDEVAAGLVGLEIDMVIDLVRRVRARGTTIVVVEHVQTLIQRLAEHVIVLDWGRKIAEGTPQEVARDPKVVEVYLGSHDGAPDVTSARGTPARQVDLQQPVLHAERLSVDYGKLRALRSVDVAVRPGEVVAVLGANGAGKSTLAQALAGLVRPSGGRILLDGADVTQQPAHARARAGIALCHEGRRLFASMTVAENLELGAARSARRAEQLERVYQLFPEIAERRLMHAGQLSGGQQQMVAIARALVAEPRVIIFDELSLGLAPVVIDRIYPALEQVRDWGIGVVLIEQNVHRALAVADRAYLIERGQISFSGTPQQLEERGLLHSAYLGQGNHVPEGSDHATTSS